MQTQHLVFAAQQAMQAGRPDEAARLWSEVLSIQPEHPQALFHLGQHRLLQKDVTGALSLLERAARADLKAAVIPLNIGFAHRAAGNAQAEIAAFNRALAIDPYFYPALLAKGATLERIGHPSTAAQIYANALAAAPSDDQVSAEMQSPLRRAREAVARNADRLDGHLRERLASAFARHPGAGAERILTAKEAMVGRAKIYAPKPSMLHFPELPAIQFYDNADFPWLEALEALTGDIREEFLGAYREEAGEFVPYVDHPDGAPLNQWAELNRSERWSVLFLWKDGRRIDAACGRFPKTAAAMQEIPRAEIPNFAPTVNFSVLAPHTRIPPHTGSTNVRLIVHLPLIVPEGCSYRVGNVTRRWVEGSAWIFDDTIEHEAWNGSSQPRAILMFDIWNPHLSPAERDMVSELLNGMQEFYATETGRIQFGG